MFHYVGMDAVTGAAIRSRDGRLSVLVNRLAGSVRFSFVEVSCVAVARCLGRSRAASRFLLGYVASRLLSVFFVPSWSVYLVSYLYDP